MTEKKEEINEKTKEVTFESLGLKPEIVKATKEMGFIYATDIQTHSLPILLQGADLIGQAHTGSGKTAAFGITILESIDTTKKMPQALVLVPTRELAMQVIVEIGKLGKHLHVSSVAVYGGAPIGRQMYEIKRGAQIVVGTPGRLMDHLRRGTLRLDGVKILVLDEADRMLDMGFIDDIQFILTHVPKTRQTLLFSATMANEIKNLAHKFMNSPEHLKVSEDVIPLDKIKQTYILLEPQKKVDILLDSLQKRKGELILVFTRTKHTADKISKIVQRGGFNALALHGNLSQNQRDRAMNAFRRGHVNVLVATDLAARGIDVLNISHVINYDLPDEPKVYSHRVGRTGRAGANGEATSLVTPDQYRELMDIERYNNVKLEREIVEGSITGPWETRVQRSSHPYQQHRGRHHSSHSSQHRSQHSSQHHSQHSSQQGAQHQSQSNSQHHSQHHSQHSGQDQRRHFKPRPGYRGSR